LYPASIAPYLRDDSTISLTTEDAPQSHDTWPRFMNSSDQWCGEMQVVVHFMDFEFDAANWELSRSGSQIHLQPQALKILAVLINRCGALVTRDELRQKMWPNQPFGDIDARLNFHIRNIRAALGDDPDNPTYIVTVPKLGYKFVAGLLAVEDDCKRSAKDAVSQG
jgi:DNA-binding winged helix-turn-helix (wHTH) protein